MNGLEDLLRRGHELEARLAALSPRIEGVMIRAWAEGRIEDFEKWRAVLAENRADLAENQEQIAQLEGSVL